MSGAAAQTQRTITEAAQGRRKACDAHGPTACARQGDQRRHRARCARGAARPRGAGPHPQHGRLDCVAPRRFSRLSPTKRRLVEAATAMLRGRAPRHGVTRPVTRRSVSTAYTARNNTIVRSASPIVGVARSSDALCCRSRGPMAVRAARSGSCTFMLARVSVIPFSSRLEPDLTPLPLQMLRSQSPPGMISLSSLRTCLRSSSVRIL